MRVPVEASGCARLIVTRPVILITTLHSNSILNAGAFGAYTNVSPTDIAVAIWKGSHTYQNVSRSGEFVINVPPAELAPKMSVFAEHLPDTTSEVEEAGCTSFEGEHTSVPSIAECVAWIECKYLQEVDVGAHSLVIGRAQGGSVEDSVLGEDGRLDVIKSRIFHSVAYPEPVYAEFGRVFRAE